MDEGENSFRQFLAGDDSDFGRLIELYYENLTYFINGYVHDLAASEELALDTLAELAIRPGRFSFRSSLKTYLFSIARHKALSLIRRRKRIRFVPLESAEGVREQVPLEEKVLNSEKKRELAAAMERLSPDMRSALTLVYIEGMSYAEAAEALGKTKKQIDNLLERAKKQLRTIIGRDGEIRP